MIKKKSKRIPKDWWPSSLTEFSQEKPLNDEYIVVAEISSPWGPDSDKLLFTALVPKDKMPGLRNHKGCIGFQASSSGPIPFLDHRDAPYKPYFWIGGRKQSEYFEPLVVRWESTGKTVLLPDQGFLMTYGLMPRYSDTGDVFWDDLANGVYEVVKVEPPSEYYFKLIRPSRVLVRSEYLQDYATARQMHLVQTYFVSNISHSPDSLSIDLAQKHEGNLDLPCRRLSLRFDLRDPNVVLAQVWGYRHLLEPGDAPILGEENYGILDWPGYGVVDGSKGIHHFQLPRSLEYVYVRDAVLGEYEGQPEFEIDPESGGVSYKRQWSVSYTERVGRDLIQVDLEKLYEGNRPNTVKTWYKYRVEPPPENDIPKLFHAQNIAKRSKNIVYGMVELGEILAGIASTVEGEERTSAELVKLDRAVLDKHFWWEDKTVEPITRHAPINMREEDFLGRCVDLFKVIGESLSEKILRKTLLRLGANENDIKQFGTIKLLERLVEMATIASSTGLNFITQYSEIESRRIDNVPKTSVIILDAVRKFRNSKSHREVDAKSAIKTFGISLQKTASGWGESLDTVYDRTIKALSDICNVLKKGMDT